MQVALGGWDAAAGRVVVSHGAYTNGGYPVARAYLTHGVDTICCIHFPLEDARRLAAEGVRGNILVMGHIAGDSVGINPYVARLRADGLEVTTFSGVIGGE
jgi:alanine racemase